jgi:M6 family metalloprotease-like protein
MPSECKRKPISIRWGRNLAGVLLVWPLTAALGLAQGRSRVVALNQRLEQILAQLPQADPPQRDNLRNQGAQLVEEREQELSALIAENPKEALEVALTPEAIAQVSAAFPDRAARLETRGIWQGEIEYLIQDSADRTSSRNHLRLLTAAGALELHLTGPVPPALKARSFLKAQGLRTGNRIAVQRTSAAVNATSGGESGISIRAVVADTPPTANLASCSLTGAQPVVTILVNFTNFTLPGGVTQDAVRGSLLGNAFAPTSQSSPDRSLDGFWKDTSDGQTSVDSATSTVVGPFTLSGNFNSGGNCELQNIQAAAIAAADSSVNFQNFSRVLIVHPNNNTCTYSGTSTVGCQTNSSPGDGTFTASVAWLNGANLTTRTAGVQLLAHEFGHGLGLGHADTRDFGPEPLGTVGSPGVVGGLGDVYSAMGSPNFGLYSAKHAANDLGWLAPTTNFQTVQANGSFVIQNYEQRPAGVKALKIRRGTSNNAWLWVEYRQNTGLYDSTLPSQVWSGVMIHYQDDSTGLRTDLLDYFQPSSDVWTNVALPSGSSWTDPYTGMTLSISGASTTSVTVNVAYVTNDNYANAAQVVNFQSAFNFSTAAFTTEGTDPPVLCGAGSKAKSAWLTFTPQFDGNAVVDTFGSNYNTIVSAYTGSPGSFVFVLCNDDSGGGQQSRMSFAVSAGVTYSVMVSAVNNDGGNLVVTISLPSGSNNFASAVPITASPFTSTTNTAGFNTEGADPTPTCGSFSLNNRAKSAWYKFTPPFSGSATIDTTGSNYDTILSVYTGSPGAFVEVACNDDFSGNFTSSVTFNVTAGVTYYVMVTAFENDGGSLTIHTTFPLTAPVRRRTGQIISE